MPIYNPNTAIFPLYLEAENAELTLPRGHVDDSGSFSSTPASEVLHLTFFRAQMNISIGHIGFSTGGTGVATGTLARVGLYAVTPGTLGLTLVGSCTNQTSWSGTFAQKNPALSTAVLLSRGNTYAVGNLQVAGTPASILGSWDNVTSFLGVNPRLCATISGKTDLPTTITNASLSTQQFPMAYVLKE